MKNVYLLGFVSLLSLASLAGCAGETSSEPSAKKDSTLSSEGDTKPAPAPAPAPVNGCTPQGPMVGGANPASKRCTDLGYQLDLETGACTFPDGTSCEEWAFFYGKCGAEHSFCATHGGTVTNKTEDMGGWTASYAYCTLPDGHSCKEMDFASTCECK